MQSIPLAVWKHQQGFFQPLSLKLHAIHTACGIETAVDEAGLVDMNLLHAIHTACGIETPT